jgi:hypothetical protein
MSSGAPSFKPKLHRTQSFAAGRESAVSPGTSEGTGYDSERHAPTIRDTRAVEAALQCSQLELQVANSALAVVVRALRRSQKINSELRALQPRVLTAGSNTIDIISSVADELTSIPPGPPAASLLPVIMEQAIKETDAFNRAFYDASMSAPVRPHSPDVSQFSVESSQHSVASPHSEYSLSSPAVFAPASDGRDSVREVIALAPMQQHMWDSVLWPVVSAKIDAIIAKSFIIEHLLDSTVQMCTSRPYPSSSCVTFTIWIDPVEHSALSSFIISHVLHPLQTLVAIAGLDINVTGPLSSAWARAVTGTSSSNSNDTGSFSSSHLLWGSLPISYHAAMTAEPAVVCASVLGQRLIQPLPFNSCSLGLIRRHSMLFVPTSYHEICVLSLPPQLPIEVPRISCVISPQDQGSIGLLQRLTLHGGALRTDEAQLAVATSDFSDWSLQQSPRQWLAAFQLKKRILQVSDPQGSSRIFAKDAGHVVIPLIGQAEVVSSLQSQLIQQLFTWFPNIRQAAESITASHSRGLKSVVLRQMFHQSFLLLSDPFAFHRSISQLQVERLPSRSPPSRPTYWVTCKDFTGSSGLHCCDQTWYKTGRADLSKKPLLRAYPPCVGETATVSWQLQTTQLLLRSLAACFGRDHQQLQVIEWFQSLSTSLATRAVSHHPVTVICGLQGSGKTTLLATSHRLFSNSLSKNFAPVEALFLCAEVFEPIATSDNVWPMLAFQIICAICDSGLASVTVTDAATAAAKLADVAREVSSKRAVAVIVDISLLQLYSLLSSSSGSHLPQLPGFMIMFSTSAQLHPQSAGYRDPDSAKLQSLCDQSKVPFLDLPLLDSRASLALVNSEISRYYHVAGHAQPADSESLSSSFHQFIQSVPVVGGHPLWIKAACRCACLLPDDWQGRLSEHAGKISALFATSAPQGPSTARSDEGAFVLRPSSTPFKPNLASSLKATAERWKRDGFDLFEKGSSTGVSSSRTLSGSQSIEHQVGSQDMGSTSANMVNETSSSPSDRCSFILQEMFDILIALAASSLNLDTKSQFVSEPSTFGSGIHVGSTQTHGFISSMLHLASVCKCPVPLYPLCSACNAAHIAASCVSWLLHEVVVLSTAGCVFVLRHMLLPKMPQNFNSLNCCLSLSVNLGHMVAIWSAAVERAIVADEGFFRTQPPKAPARDEHSATPSKILGNSPPIEKRWFELCANAMDSNHDSDHVFNSPTLNTFALHSLLNCLVFSRLGGLLQQWLMTPACAMMLGSSEISRFSTRRFWDQSIELGAPSAAAVLMCETKRAKASTGSLSTLLSLLTSANSYRILQMYALKSSIHNHSLCSQHFRNDEASDVFDSAASLSTRLFGNSCALTCRLLICAAMCHRLVKRFVAAKERCFFLHSLAILYGLAAQYISSDCLPPAGTRQMETQGKTVRLWLRLLKFKYAQPFAYLCKRIKLIVLVVPGYR